MSFLYVTGLDELKKVFKESIIKLYSLGEERDFYLTSPRHYEIFLEMKEVVSKLLEGKPQLEELLFALNDLVLLYDKLIGRNVSDKDINQIFSRFCIGK